MRLASLDRRVRREAKALVAEAKRGIGRVKLPMGVGDELRTRVSAVEAALASGDLARVRRGLPALDALVDEHLTPSRKSTGREYGESITIAIVIALLLRSFVIEAFKIPSASMIPTMEIGDHIFVNKFIYGIRIPFTRIKLFEWRTPARGEVIVFMNPCTPEKDFIKRVVAVAGDTVEVRCDLLYVNGKTVVPELVAEEDCRYSDYNETTDEWNEVTSCSRYREHVGDHVFDALHERERPERDRERKDTGDRMPYSPWEHDFPRDLPEFRNDPLVDYHSPFSCQVDRRTPEERAPSMGTFEWSTPEAPAGAHGTCGPQLHYVVPPGHVFVMGDNRDNSSDSRMWGPVPLGHIKGKALFIWWSHGTRDGVRLGRMGGIVH